MLEIIAFGGAFLVGALVGRWWIILLAIPLGVWSAYEIPLENTEPPHVDLGLVVGLVLGACLTLGVAVRWLLSRDPHP